MPDHLSLHPRQDRARVSSQPHEIAYLRARIKELAPGKSDEDIEAAIQYARGEAQPSESRQEILMLIKRRLRL